MTSIRGAVSISLLLSLTGCAAGQAPASGPTARPAVAKQVYALYFPHHRTREHDGNLGSWQKTLTAKKSKAHKTYFNYNPDLVAPGGRHDVAATVYPLVGMQSDMDPDYQEFQILQARTAHIDAFIVDWILPGNYGWEHAMRSLLKMAERYDFKLGIDFIAESHFEWYQNVDPAADTRRKKAEAIKKSLQYALDQFYHSPAALVVEGHPVIFLFGGTKPEEFRWIRRHPYRVPEGMKRPWFIRRATIGIHRGHMEWTYNRWAPLVDGTFGWILGPYRLSGKPIPPEMLATYDYYLDSDDMDLYARGVVEMNQKHFETGEFSMRVGSACPGFDNRGCAGWERTLWMLEREQGRTYERQWAVNVANRDKVDAVFCVTWNDYTEATTVEPTAEHGFTDMEITQKYAAAFKGIPSDPSGIRLPARLFALRKRARFLNHTGFDTDAVMSRLDRVGVAVNERRYVKAAAGLDEAEKMTADMDRQVRSEKVAVSVPGEKVKATAGPERDEGVWELARRDRLCLRFDESVARVLRERNFDGYLTFEFFDEGKNIFDVVTSPARPDGKGPRHVARLFSEVCRIRKDDTGVWRKARVKLFKVNCGFGHDAANGSDFVFGPNVKVRNIAFAFDVFSRAAE
ncbi:MAG: glycoside hydrolase family 71/99 protein [Planctomycetota bacterium]